MHTSRRPLAASALLLVLALLAACSSSSKTSTNSSSSTGSSNSSTPAFDYASLSGSLNGSGSTFQDAFDQKAITDLHGKASNLSITYTKSGSSAGKQDLQNKVVQFAGTDSLIKDED